MRLIVLILLRLFALSLVFAILIVAARGIGTTQAPSQALAALHLTDCALPCWSGITPGETTYAEAAQRITALYPAQDVTIQETQIFIAYLLNSSYGAANLDLSGGIVHAITLHAGDVDGLTIGDAAALFGTSPCVLSQTPPVLIYNAGDIFALAVAYGGGEERWHQPLGTIEIQRTELAHSSPFCPTAPNSP